AVVGAQGSRGVRYCAAAAGLLLLMLALALLSARDMSITYDETGHLRYGRQLLHGDARRFDDSKMPVSALNALPGVVATALPAGGLRNALAGLYAARVPTMLAAAVGRARCAAVAAPLRLRPQPAGARAAGHHRRLDRARLRGRALLLAP